MKISKKSSIYIFTAKWTSSVNYTHNLCEFVRKLFFAIFLSSLVYFVIGSAILSAIFQVAYIINVGYLVGLLDNSTIADNYFFMFFVIDVFAFGVLLIMGWIGLARLIGYSIANFQIKRMTEKGQVYPKQKEPSVILEYLKAKKQKICPFIVFKD